jgi:hypothetical protein
MKPKVMIPTLLGMSILLFGSNLFLSAALRNAIGGGTEREIGSLREERARLAAERTRLEDRLESLDRLVAEIRTWQERADDVRSEPEPTAGDSDMDAVYASAAEPGITERPRPAELPLLSEEEKADLQAWRAIMPGNLSEGPLLLGDVDTVTGNPQWNPDGIDLDEEGRLELARLLSEYRYFARLSFTERFNHYVLPEIPRLRDSGAFVEYPAEDPPPRVEGTCTSHSEASDRPGYRRLYYFFEDDYPELAHHKRVERERVLERFVQIYRLLNPGLGESP